MWFFYDRQFAGRVAPPGVQIWQSVTFRSFVLFENVATGHLIGSAVCSGQ